MISVGLLIYCTVVIILYLGPANSLSDAKAPWTCLLNPPVLWGEPAQLRFSYFYFHYHWSLRPWAEPSSVAKEDASNSPRRWGEHPDVASIDSTALEKPGIDTAFLSLKCRVRSGRKGETPRTLARCEAVYPYGLLWRRRGTVCSPQTACFYILVTVHEEKLALHGG